MKMIVGKHNSISKPENGSCRLEISEIHTMYFLYIVFYDVMYPFIVTIDDDTV